METQNNKNIDQHFRKLAEEQKPKAFKNSDAVWDKIEEKLDEKKKKRIIPIWKYFEINKGVKYAGIAAALLLLITLGSRFINNNPTVENAESETNQIVFVDEDKVKEEFDNLQNSEDVVAFEDVEELKDRVVQKQAPVVSMEIAEESEIVMDYSYSEIQTSPPDVVVAKETITSIVPSNDDSTKDKIGVRSYFDSKRTKEEIENAYFRGNAYSKQLQGEVSGVNVFAGNGSPGSDNTIRIRGKNSLNGNTEPLYIIDGKPISSDEFRKINANDIENISVLKDENATSSYGSRGANGVILIQSKKDFKKKGKRNVGENIK